METVSVALRICSVLRLDPAVLERAYQELGIEPHTGSGEGGATVYEIAIPENVD